MTRGGHNGSAGRVLVVEDDEGIREMLKYNLVTAGFSVHEASDGASGLRTARTARPDLILLDLMLPGMSGFDFCRALRKSSRVPIIMITAKDAEVDKIVGLELGADDYVTKPFEMMELMARIEALLRRAPMRTQEPDEVQQFGDLKIDLRGTEVSRDGKNVPLSAREFQLLRYLVENRGKTVSRGELLKEVWGYNAATYTRTVDMHVASLRQKIEDDPKQPQLVVTVPGLGYKFASA
jgi:two-component system alkaline phosphatase synthesis response regulator PhoP